MTEAPIAPELAAALAWVAHAVVDPWCCVDGGDRLLRFNQAFRDLAGAGLEPGTALAELVSVPALGSGGLRAACAASGSVRLETVEATVAGKRGLFRISAAPFSSTGSAGVLLVVLSERTEVQRLLEEHQQLLARVRALEHELDERVAARTRELIAANDEINRLERELARLRRGGY